MSKSHFFLPLPVCGSLQFCLAGSSRMSSLPFKVKDRFFCSLFEIASVTCTRASYVELASKFSINEDASCTSNIRNSVTTVHKWRRMDSPPQSPPGYSGGWHQPLLSSTRHHQPGEEQAYSEDGSNFCLPVNMQTLPKAQRTRGLSSAYQINFFRSYRSSIKFHPHNLDRASTSKSQPNIYQHFD